MTAKLRTGAMLAAGLAVLLAVLSCAPHELVERSASFSYTGDNPVYAIDFGDADILHLTVTGTFDPAGQDLFLVKANVSNYQVSAASSGGLYGSSRGKGVLAVPWERAATPAASAAAPVAGSAERPVFLKDLPAASAFNRNPPPFREAPPGIMARELTAPAATVYYGDSPGFSEGEARSFYVLDGPYEPGEYTLDSWDYIAAALQYLGEYCYVWVADANFGAGSNSDNKVTATQASDFGKKFDGTFAGLPYGIFELVTTVFGYEYGGGPSGEGGIDDDQHISILIYDVDYDYSATQDSGIVGYFWGKDEYDDTEAQGWNVRSNEMEIFCIDAYFLDKYPEIAVSTLAHEYQHMIHFNEKWVEHGVSSPTWYEEMLSMLAEDLLQDHLVLDDEDSPKSRSSYFNETYWGSGVVDWLDADRFASYASAYIFGAFLARNYGGAELVQSIMANEHTGRRSITAALGDLFNPEDFDDVFRAYAPALIYSTPPVLGIKVINTPDVASLAETAYTLSAFDIYDYENGYFDDYGGKLYGPVVFYTSYQQPLRPYGLTLHSEDAWLGLAGDLSFTIDLLAPASSVATYLMVR